MLLSALSPLQAPPHALYGCLPKWQGTRSLGPCHSRLRVRVLLLPWAAGWDRWGSRMPRPVDEEGGSHSGRAREENW